MEAACIVGVIGLAIAGGLFVALLVQRNGLSCEIEYRDLLAKAQALELTELRAKVRSLEAANERAKRLLNGEE